MTNLERRLAEAGQAMGTPTEDMLDRGRAGVLAWSRGTSDAIPAPAHQHPRSRRRLVIPALAATATVALIGTLAFFGAAGGPSPISLDRAAAAIEPTGEIEHSVFTQDGTKYEQWNLPGKTSKIVATQSDGQTMQVAGPPICSYLSAAGSCESTGEAIRSRLRSGQARLESSRLMIQGRPAARIVLDGVGTNNDIKALYDVDAETLKPVRITATIPGEGIVVSNYSTYEYLAATPENLKLLEKTLTP